MQLSVGSNFIQYPPPEVRSIFPVQFQSGTEAVVTLIGKSFGANESDVHVYLRLSAGGEAACDTKQLVNDAQIVCTFLAKKGRKIEGVFVVSAGSDWSGGEQNSTTGANSQVKEIDPPAEVAITIAKDIAEIPPGSPQEAEFIASFTMDISKAIGVPEDRINVTGIQAGSIVVVFVILPDPTSIKTLSPAAAAAEIVKQASNPAVSVPNPSSHVRAHV